jgi:hypothetical protein
MLDADRQKVLLRYQAPALQKAAMRLFMWLARPLTTAAIPLAVAGCLSFGGGSDTTTINQPTIGQQLLDLKKAYDAGTMSKEEYELMREAILRGQK